MSGLDGYDQWKTASPYDDEPDEETIATCQCCKETFDSDQEGVCEYLFDMVVDEPSPPAIVVCGNCLVTVVNILGDYA
jgi:hypothetical protein